MIPIELFDRIKFVNRVTKRDILRVIPSGGLTIARFINFPRNVRSIIR